MKRLSLVLICFAAISFFVAGEVVGRGPGGGGRGGGMSRGGGGGPSRGGGGPSRGGGGMSHSGSSRSPSMSRSSPGGSRSSGGMSRPSAGGSRPSGGSHSRPTATPPSTGSRPSTGNRPSTGSRPSTGNRPNTEPGGNTPGSGSRPETGTRPGGGSTRPGESGRPSEGQLNDFLELPQSGGGGTPGSGTRPGSGASDFLQNNPQVSRRPSERPGAGDRPSERPRTGEGPASENRPDRLDNRQDNRQDSFDNRTDQQSDRQDSVSDRRDNAVDNRQDRRDNLSDNRADRIDNLDERRSDRIDRRTEVRQQVRRTPPRNDFWRGNRYAQRWTHPYRGAAWGSVAAWFPWGWSQPISYSYGDNVYVEGDTVYYGEEAVGTAQEYSEQAFAIASSADEVAPDESGDDTEWLSLGVFAMVQDGQASGPEPNLFVQLAVSKEGMIAGTYYNSSTKSPQDIEGVVDKKTQRAAWTVGSKDWPVMETGISNLTKDEAPALIHFADGQTQRWLLVRLEDPKGQQSN